MFAPYLKGKTAVLSQMYEFDSITSLEMLKFPCRMYRSVEVYF